MPLAPLISWTAPTHIHYTKTADWYWTVGIITVAISAVCFIFSQIIPAIFVIVSAVALVLNASRPPKIVRHEINDRGIVIDNILYPFLTLDSFWIPHDEEYPYILLKSHKTFMPLTVIIIDQVNPDDVREILLKYIAETEHREPFLKKVLEWLGF